MESNQEHTQENDIDSHRITRFFAIEQVENSDVFVLHAGKLDMQCGCPFAPNQVGKDDKGNQFFYRPPCNTTCPLVTLTTSDGKEGVYHTSCGNGSSFQRVEILRKSKIIAETKKGLILPTV